MPRSTLAVVQQLTNFINVKPLFGFIRYLAESQVEIFLRWFDPVKTRIPPIPSSNNGQSQSRINYQFLFPLVAYLFKILFGLYVLPDKLTWSQVFSRRFYATNARVYYHQMYSRANWRQGEIVYGTTVVWNIAILAVLAFITRPIESRFWIFALPEQGQMARRVARIASWMRKNVEIGTSSNFQNHKLARKLLTFRRKARWLLKGSLVFFFLYLHLFLSKGVRTNGHYRSNEWQDVLFWFVLSPIAVLYYIFGK